MQLPGSFGRRTPRQQLSFAEQFGVEQDLEQLKASERWGRQAVAMLAEAVAGLLLEVQPRSLAEIRRRPRVPKAG